MSFGFDPTRTPDVAVIGGGLIGLALALELNDRGGRVTVIERRKCLAGASTAAAGMLAAEDPGNPPEVRELSRLSAERYPAFLGRLEALSGIAIPFQTDATVQYAEGGSTVRLVEQSLDPRQLAGAVRAAVQATSIELLEETDIREMRESAEGTTFHLRTGRSIAAGAVVYAAGAWTSEVMSAMGVEGISVKPCKGQMLRVRLPFALNEVHRSERIYICPRRRGPQAGTALIGATVEDAGFDTSVRAESLDALRALAATLIPELESADLAPMVESWAGLRPSTADKLPLLGETSRRGHFLATGHYRNGILQAPGTAVVMANLIEGKAPGIELAGLSPLRFAECLSGAVSERGAAISVRAEQATSSR